MATGGVFQIISCCGNQKSIPSSAFQSDTIMASEMTSNEAPEVKTEVELLYEEIHRIFPVYDSENADFYFSLFAHKGFLEEAEKYVDDVLALHAGDNVSVALDERYKGNLNAVELLYKHGAEITICHYNVHLCHSIRGVDMFMKYMDPIELDKYLTKIDSAGRISNGSYLFITGHSLETVKHIIEKYPHVLKYSNVFCTDETKKHTPQAKTYEVFEELVKFYGPEMLYEYNHKGRQLSDYGARWVQDHVTFTDVKGPTGCTGTVTLTDAKGITGDTLEDTKEDKTALDQGQIELRLKEIAEEMRCTKRQQTRLEEDLSSCKTWITRIEAEKNRLEERKSENEGRMILKNLHLEQFKEKQSKAEKMLTPVKTRYAALVAEQEAMEKMRQTASASKVE